MAVNFRTRNQVLLAEIQAALGTEETPDPATDAVRVRPFAFEMTPNVLQTNYVQGGVDESAPVVGPGPASFRVSTILQGSGTGGTAPDIGRLLRACGFAQTLTTPAVAGTATAGAAGSITLAVSASTTVDFYKGMVIRTTGGTGSGQARIITAYSAGRVASVFPQWTVTPDATTGYSIDANARYRTTSAAIDALTMWGYFLHSDGTSNAIRRRLMDARGTFAMRTAPRGFPEIDFTFRGKMPANPDSVAAPAAAVYGTESSQPFVSAQCYMGTPGTTTEPNARLQISELALDMGIGLEAFDDPAAVDGYDSTDIVTRAPTVTIVPNLLKTPRNIFDDMLSNTDRTIWVNWGAVAGKRVSLLFPTNRPIDDPEEDVRGFGAERATLRAHGIDDSVWISLW